jgi:hypothetical protein
MRKYWHLIYVKFCFHGSEQTARLFFHHILSFNMLYSLELQMAGIILFTAMIAGGISLWIKRRKLEKESTEKESLRQDMSEDI